MSACFCLLIRLLKGGITFGIYDKGTWANSLEQEHFAERIRLEIEVERGNLTRDQADAALGPITPPGPPDYWGMYALPLEQPTGWKDKLWAVRQALVSIYCNGWWCPLGTLHEIFRGD